ncbi:hypothetical protein [Streptomyces sp. NPDC006463]|uniref:hypothetical protein n=1 Tax=Streptomyces sp. NPDC006463 TaxID=3364746 RepID=UPI0036CF0983
MAGSGVFAKAAGAVGGKTVAVVGAGALAVTAAAGAGVWWVSRGPDPVVVVQRSTSVSVPAGGQQLTVTGCLPHETALGGGYAIAGTGFATNSHFIGGAWLASAYNPGDAPATLTSYALCVNARPQMQPGLDFTWRAHAFRDRSNKMRAGDDGEFRDLTSDGPYAGLKNDPLATPVCGGGYTMVGTEFRSGRIVQGRAVAPVPLDRMTPKGAAADYAAAHGDWVVSVNPGTQLSTRSFTLRDSTDAARLTRIEDPQPPQANFAVGVRPVCVKVTKVSVATAQVSVAAGGSADATVHCPKGRLVLGGGFVFPAANESVTREAMEAPQRYFGDGWLFASADAPAAAGEPSGRPVREWHVHGVNQQQAGGLYHNSVWIEHSDAETSTGNGYFDSHAHGGDDQQLRPAAIPDGQQMVAAVMCGSIDAEATSPSKGPSPTAVGRPDLPQLPEVPGATAPAASGSPSPTGSPSDSPSASPSHAPSASPSSRTPNSPGPSGTSGRPGTSGSPVPSTSAPQQPQPPAVSIRQPAAGGQLRRGCEESFAGTARTRPGDRALTDPQYTTWQLKGPNGPVALGSGPSGTFLVPLLPDGTYSLVFTATDPGNGLTAAAQVSVRIVGCLR